jgi:formylglycine-generating enzyme required for sulfatase activity
MLQARQFACILLLIANAWSGSTAWAQDDAESAPAREFQRLGDQPVDEGLNLELNVPQPKEPPVRPETPEERQVREQREREQAMQRLLAAARQAEDADRIDQPAGDSAWFYYRKALDLDPQNEAAMAGLQRVQRAMVENARFYAKELDFETADRLLDEAALVWDNPQYIEQSRQEMAAFRTDYAAKLEIQAVTAMDAGRFKEAERVLIELVALGGMDSMVNQLRRRMEEARVYGGLKPGQIIRDHFVNQGFWTPDSVIVRAGSGKVGSSAFEEGRRDNEGPEHRVTLRRGFAIGRTEVTVGQFRVFVEKTGYKTDAEKHGESTVYDEHSGRLTAREGINWKMDYEGKRADDNLPVVHVSWNDATAYTKWLSRGTGKPYRLPSEAEFEYALRAGSTSRYWWGDGSPAMVVENLTGDRDTSRGRRQWDAAFENYGDRYWGPAPVASFEPNPFGLQDMGGNVGEWVLDCWHDTYIRAPVDGSAWINPGCAMRVIRGGFWASSPDQARSAFRLSAKPERRDARIGFRIARDL